MFNLCWLLHIFLFYKAATSHPFVFENVLNTCSYNSSAGNLMLTSKIWKVEYEGIVIRYTLCGYLPEEICGENAAACLIDKDFNIIGKQFILGNHNSLKLISGNFCKANSTKKYKITVKFDCYQDMEEASLEKENDCEYTIYMMDPKCELHCITKIDNQLIDLRKLKGNYFVTSKKNKTFSIALCGAKQQCSDVDGDISVCEKYSDGIIPLSKFKNERIIYSSQKNEIIYRGSYKEENGLNKFELLFKCDWESIIGQIKYREVQTQGKDYKFIMDSSYGCVKLPSECVVTDMTLIYNLTNLFSNSGGYKVLNVPNGTVIYLNICGSLKFKDKPENSCSKSFSQVCEVKDGKYINRGSIMSKFTVSNDVIRVSYIDGVKCKENPLKWYSTHIDFFCSKTDHGPSFVKTDECDLFINWNSPYACPNYNKSSCEYKPQENYDCSVIFQGSRYDLNPLKLDNSSYEINNPKNKSIKYFLNVCGSVTDPESPCMKSSMVIMKDMEETNLKYRTKSLGEMDLVSVDNKQIVITTLSGTYCGIEGDFTSSLRLICGSETLPILVKNTQCTYQFEWTTPYGCLNKTHSNRRQCIISDPSNDISLNFTEAKIKSVKLNINEMNYVFDICKDSYSECLPNACQNVPLMRHLTLSSNTTFLEMFLPKICDTENPINKVVFELVCDQIEHNEHFEIKEKSRNCTVKLLLYTNLVCSREEFQMDEKDKIENYLIPNENGKLEKENGKLEKENGKYFVQNENELNQESENCSVINYMTGYKINLNTLQLNISTICPAVYFYEHNRSVVLIYSSSRTCNKSTLGAKYEYKAVLICSNQGLRKTEKVECFQEYHLEGPEFCKLFEFSALDMPQKSNTVTVISSCLGVIVLIIICCFCFYKWKRYRRQFPYNTVYNKDGDL